MISVCFPKRATQKGPPKQALHKITPPGVFALAKSPWALSAAAVPLDLDIPQIWVSV